MSMDNHEHGHGHGFGTLPHTHEGGDRPHTRADHDEDRFLCDCYTGVKVQPRDQRADPDGRENAFRLR